MQFKDRIQAGRLLAQRLVDLKDEQPIVLALPRGGVPVAFEVATALNAPLDVLVARKLGAPYQPEFGFGAIAPGAVYLDDQTIRMLGLSDADIQQVMDRERKELERRERMYRAGRQPVSLEDRTVILVDDGLATGSTARAAIASAEKSNPRRIVLAVPVAAPESAAAIEAAGTHVVSVARPVAFQAVGKWYGSFPQTSDQEVVELLGRASAKAGPPSHEERRRPLHSTALELDVGRITLSGDLHLPEGATTLVIFAHGSGSSRHSPRNQFVAQVLQERGHGTLLFDLLTLEEEQVDLQMGHLRFDIDMLSQRLVAITEWVRQYPDTRELSIGVFGASTGAAAALKAAAEIPDDVKAVVSRGGRPDLAGDALPRVKAPTLLIVGGSDTAVIRLNKDAMRHLNAENTLSIVPQATHLFAEPGALEQVARLAGDWFSKHLVSEPYIQPVDEATGRQQAWE